MAKIEKRDEAVRPAAPFRTVDEEAEFWDTHSVIDDIDEGTVVGFRTARKIDTLTVRFEPRDIRRIRAEARERGIGPSTLIRNWVMEHLHQPGQAQ